MSTEYKKISKLMAQPPKILLFGSSTGGLNALSVIMKDFKGKKIDIPIAITQHIPSSFDNNFAKTITDHSGMECFIGANNMTLENGKIYVAPAGYHMELRRYSDNEPTKIILSDDPPINYCKPAVDPLFFSASKIYGKNILAVILTGIGSDGLQGAKEIVSKGGTLLAQDEETSVVWGMPGAVAKAGICTDILPLNKITENIIDYSFGKIR